MPGFELILLVLVLVGLPLESELTLRRDRTRLRMDQPGARQFHYMWIILVLWFTAAVVLGATAMLGHAWTEFRLGFGDGGVDAILGWAMALLLAGGVAGQYLALERYPERRAQMRERLGDLGPLDAYLPKTEDEVRLFTWVGISAGICEEIIFRGYLIWALAGYMPELLAALISLAVFVSLHRYQGQRGMFQVTIIGALLTVVTLLADSIWPAVLMHVVIDVVNGRMLFLLRSREKKPA